MYLKISLTVVCVNCILKHFLCCSSHCVFKQYDSTEYSELLSSWNCSQPCFSLFSWCALQSNLALAEVDFNAWNICFAMLLLHQHFCCLSYLTQKKTEYFLSYTEIFKNDSSKAWVTKLSKLNKCRICQRVGFSRCTSCPLECFRFKNMPLPMRLPAV